MDCRHRFGSFGNSCIALGSSDPEGQLGRAMVGPSGYFFLLPVLSIFSLFSSYLLVLCHLISFLLFPCASVRGVFLSG